MHISNDIRYIGVNDHQIDLFEGQYIVPNGMAYNSYVIMDEKIAVLDTVDQHFGADWFANLEKELDGRQPDYLVVHHMEPDHSANIGSFAAKYPNAKIVASLPAFNMMKKYYETDFPRAEDGGQGRQHAGIGKAYPDFYRGGHGSLAGGADEL